MPDRPDPYVIEPPTILARHQGPRGEVVLRRRPGSPPVEELIVNGVFAMYSADTSTERELARAAARADRVLVGGLGLGHTAAELLDADVRHLDVVEIEPCLLEWARAGLTPVLEQVAADPRSRLWAGDVARVLDGSAEGPRGPWDAILLDIDNGPDFLIHQANRAIYAEPALRNAYRRLTPVGVLGVWSQSPSPALLAALRAVDDSVTEHLYDSERDGRTWRYALYTVRRTTSSLPEGGVEGRAAVDRRE